MKKETMTSRERVKRTVKHLPVDRMPIDLGMHFSTGISAFAYHALRRKLGLDTDNIVVPDAVCLLARVDEDVAERFHLDTTLLNPVWPNSFVWNPRGEYKFIMPAAFRPERAADGAYSVEFKGIRLRMPARGFFFDGGWPDYYDLPIDEKLALFAKNAERIRKETDKYTMMMGFHAFFGGLEFACRMLLEPEACKEQNERTLQNQIAYWDKVNAAMGRYIDCIEVNSDLGTQMGLACTPDSYEECCYPYLKRFCEHVHETSDVDIFLHSCGGMSELLPLIIDAGVDILNPVQISARTMEPEFLKARYGDKICFWGGGCNTQTVLGSGTPAEVAEDVRRNIAVFKPNGGFVFNQVHNVMGNVPPENVIAMLDTAYENAFYD